MIKLDFDTKWTLISRVWMVLAGFLTVLLIPTYLDATEQGYYFTFLSILTLQIFFELGMNQIIVQFVSHEVANDKNELIKNSERKSHQPSFRLMALIKSLRRWYLFIAGFFGLLVIPIGWIFFSLDDTTTLDDWLLTWIIVVVVTAVNLYFSAFLAACEGFGKVGNVARLRFSQNLIGYILFWLALMNGFGLFSVCIVPFINAIFSSTWLSKQNWLKFNPNDDGKSKPINWTKDILPMQWRIAVSWISGYFIHNLFVPITFATYGPIEAGKLGIALAIFTAISTIGLSLVNAKFPLMGSYVANKDRKSLDDLFDSVSIKSLTINTLLSSSFVLFVVYLGNTWSLVTDRISDWKILTVLSLVVILNTHISSMALYMRAHKQEPMLLVSVVMGVLVCLGIFFGIRFGVFFMLSVYLMMVVLISFPWTFYLWSGYRKIHF